MSEIAAKRDADVRFAEAGYEAMDDCKEQPACR